MQSDAAEIGSSCEPVVHRKERLWTLESLDRRTRSYQRARELIAALETELGGRDRLSVIERLDVETAAVLSAIAEDKAARMLAGESIGIAELVKLTNAARRAVRTLSLPKAARGPARVPLRERLAAEAEQAR